MTFQPMTRTKNGNGRAATKAAPTALVASGLNLRYNAADMDAVLAGLDVLDFNSPAGLQRVFKPLSYQTIDWQGRKGSGKSAASAGNPHAVVLKFIDGLPMLARVQPRAKIIHITGLYGDKGFYETIRRLEKYAMEHGPDDWYHTLVLDPVTCLADWLAADAVATGNEKLRKRYENDLKWAGKQNKDAPDEPIYYKQVSDIPSGAMLVWPAIGREILDIGNRFRSLGWGFQTCTHYRLGMPAELEEDGAIGGQRQKKLIPREWRPDSTPSVYSGIAKAADVRVILEKTADGDSVLFLAKLTANDSPECGARVPVPPCVFLPNYNDPRTPAGRTSWDALSEAWDKGVAKAIADQQAYIQAVGTASPALDAAATTA